MPARLLRQARNVAGFSQEKLAEHVGTSRQQISRLEKDQRVLTKSWAERLAPHLGLTPQQLLFPVTENFAMNNDQIELSGTGIPIIGDVAAGVWLEDTTLVNAEPEYLPFNPDNSLPIEALYALRVRGDSINKIAPDDAILICLDIAISGIKITPGKLYIVEAHRHQGGLVERTVKRVHKHGDSLELVPESTNPSWKPVIYTPEQDGGDLEIRIVARVEYIVTRP